MGDSRKKKEERKKERLNDGNNNGQTTHGAHKPPGPIIEADFGVFFLLFTNSVGSWKPGPLVPGVFAT